MFEEVVEFGRVGTHTTLQFHEPVLIDQARFHEMYNQADQKKDGL